MLVAFLFSLAPRFDVAGVELYTPNELLRHIVPFRSYSRFAIVVLSVAAILMALTIDRSRKPVAWTTLVILIASLDTLSGFYLHATHADRDYIRYLRERPENTMMRFDDIISLVRSSGFLLAFFQQRRRSRDLWNM